MTLIQENANPTDEYQIIRIPMRVVALCYDAAMESDKTIETFCEELRKRVQYLSENECLKRLYRFYDFAYKNEMRVPFLYRKHERMSIERSILEKWAR